MPTLGACDRFAIRNALRGAAVENPRSMAAAAKVVWPCGKNPKDYVPEVNTLPGLCIDLHVHILVQVLLCGGTIQRVKDAILALTASYPRKIIGEDQLLVEVVRTVVRMARVEQIPWAYPREWNPLPDLPLLCIPPAMYGRLGVSVEDLGDEDSRPSVSLRIHGNEPILGVVASSMPRSWWSDTDSDEDSYDPLDVPEYWHEDPDDPYYRYEYSPAPSPRALSPSPIPVCRWCETDLDPNGACTSCAEPVCKLCGEPLTALAGRCEECAEKEADEFADWRTMGDEDFTVVHVVRSTEDVYSDEESESESCW